MSLLGFDRERVQERLSHLGAQGQVAFAALCAERLLPYYRWFSKIEHWGDHERLRKALDAIWSYVDAHPLSTAEYERLIAEVSRLTPDTEDFQSPVTSRALDAAVTIVQGLRMCLEPSERRAAEVAEVAVDAAFGVDQMRSLDDLGEIRIADRAQLAHLFSSGGVQQELETQSAILDDLASQVPLNVGRLRERYGLTS